MTEERHFISREIIYSLKSIVHRLEVRALFAEEQPLEVELGSGDGSFLVNWAAAHPDRNFIGVERLLGRIRKMERKARRAEADNVRGIRIESRYFLEYLLPEHSATALHIYFPDPWPKRRHREHRLVRKDFPELARKVLAPQGTVLLRTDDADYFEQMVSVFGASADFKETETPADLSAVVTDFERNFQSRGISTLRAAFVVKN